jgi:hypothetical protein
MATQRDLHYGPEWAWDWNRPEAIEARRQIQEGYMQRYSQARDEQALLTELDLLANSPTKYFRIIAAALLCILENLPSRA